MNFLLMNKIKLGWLAAFMYDIKIDFFGLNINIGDLSGSLTSIIQWGFGYSAGGVKDELSGIWNFGTTLNSYLSTVATSLLVLFLMMEFVSLCTRTGDMNSITWERILMTVSKYFMVYALYKSAPYVMTTILNITHDWFLTFTSQASIVGKSASLASTIETAVDAMDFTPRIISTVMMALAGTAYIGTAVAAISGVFQRAVKMVLLYGIAPIPITMMAYHETAHTGKRYIMNWFSTLVEGILIYIMIGIYSLGCSQLQMEYTDSDKGQNSYKAAVSLSVSISLLNAVLTGGISLAGNVAREALG